LWEECIQEGTRVANREALLKEDDQALAAHARKGKRRPHLKREARKESQPPKRIKRYQRGKHKPRDLSSYQCYNCDKMGHVSRNCPQIKDEFKIRINNNKRHHAHAAE